MNMLPDHFKGIETVKVDSSALAGTTPRGRLVRLHGAMANGLRALLTPTCPGCGKPSESYCSEHCFEATAW